MSALDWGILVIYLTAVAGIGAWIGRGQKDSSDFLLGGRSIPWWAALLSLVATEISAATFLGAPEFGYRHDLTFLQIGLGAIVARFVLAHFFIGVYYSAGVTTVYEFLGRRFGGMTQRVTGGLFLFGRLFADGSRLFIAAITIEVVSGLPIEVSILSLAAVTVVYTSIGGIKAVVWTDVVQAFILVGAGFALLASLLLETGLSTAEISSQLQEADKFRLFGTSSDWLKNPNHVLTALLGGFFLTLATHGTDHDMVQRLLTCRTSAGSRRSMWLSGFIGLTITALFLAIGLVLYVYTQNLDPTSELARTAQRLNSEGKNGHYLLFYALAKLPQGLIGLVVAGILAAAMSSLSSALNAMTATFISDFYRPLRKDLEADELKVTRFTNLVMGISITSLALFISSYVRHHPEVNLLSLALGVMTFFYGGLLGIFLVALFTKSRGNNRTNLAAAVLSTLVAFAMFSEPDIAWEWRIVVGTFVSVLVSASGATPMKNHTS